MNKLVMLAGISTLFSLVSTALTEKGFSVRGIENPLHLQKEYVPDTDALVIACRPNEASKGICYPDVHSVPLAMAGKRPESINIFSQEHINKTFDSEAFTVKYFKEKDQRFGLAMIYKKQPNFYENLTSNLNIDNQPQQISGPTEPKEIELSEKELSFIENFETNDPVFGELPEATDNQVDEATSEVLVNSDNPQEVVPENATEETPTEPLPE